MKVANRFSVGAWGRFRRRNGWMMMDLLLAMTFVVLTVTAFLPLISQTVSFDRRAHIQEALLRQAVSIEASVFQELVYGQEWEVSPDSIRFKTPQGRDVSAADRRRRYGQGLPDSDLPLRQAAFLFS